MNKTIIGILIGIAIVTGIVRMNKKSSTEVGAPSITASSSSMTYQEYQDYIEMMNYEVKRINGRIKNVKSKKDLIKKLNKRALNRPVRKRVRMHRRNYNRRNYKARRRRLINKANKSLR